VGSGGLVGCRLVGIAGWTGFRYATLTIFNLDDDNSDLLDEV
jgi:hypothetical protein